MRSLFDFFVEAIAILGLKGRSLFDFCGVVIVMLM
jgi:hypothetical protein